MDGITLGLVCGLVFGIIDVLIMLPIKVADKRKRIESLGVLNSVIEVAIWHDGQGEY